MPQITPLRVRHIYDIFINVPIVGLPILSLATLALGDYIIIDSLEKMVDAKHSPVRKLQPLPLTEPKDVIAVPVTRPTGEMKWRLDCPMFMLELETLAFLTLVEFARIV